MVLETSVGQLLEAKSLKGVLSVTPNTLVFDAMRTMAIHNVGALLVIENDEILGIISERDYARKVVLANRTSRNTKVSEIMECEVFFVAPNDPIEGCLSLMSEKRVGHLPVLNRGELIGLISMGDVVNSMISDQEFMIDQLTQYIYGSHSGWFDQNGPGRATVNERTI